MNKRDKLFLEKDNLLIDQIFMKLNLSKEFMDLSLAMLICLLKSLMNMIYKFFRVIRIIQVIWKYGT